MPDFTGKVVLVTGAGRGTGRTAALAFARAGARLAVDDVTPINLDETVAAIRAAGGQVRAYIGDIAKKLPVQGLLNQVLDDHGCIDILVNCAQVEPQKTILEMDEWDWQRTLDVDLTGAFLLTQSVGRIMSERGAGTIILVGGRAHGTERRAAFFACQAALVELAARADRELRPSGVRVFHLDGQRGRDQVDTILELAGG